MTTHSYSYNTGALYMETPYFLRYFKRPRHSKFSILDKFNQFLNKVVEIKTVSE